MSLIGRLIQSALEMPSTFTEIALQDPLTAILVAVGSLLFGVVGLLSLYVVVGVLVQVVTPTETGQTRRPVR